MVREMERESLMKVLRVGLVEGVRWLEREGVRCLGMKGKLGYFGWMDY